MDWKTWLLLESLVFFGLIFTVIKAIFLTWKGMLTRPKARSRLMTLIRGPDLTFRETEFGVTEKYAKATFWCPYHVMKSGDKIGYNRSTHDTYSQFKWSLIFRFFPYYAWWKTGKYGKCSASGCALWRWHDYSVKKSERIGYCGGAEAPGSRHLMSRN